MYICPSLDNPSIVTENGDGEILACYGLNFSLQDISLLIGEKVSEIKECSDYQDKY